MKAKDYVKPILLFTGISSLGQSIAWFIMSLLAILAYRCELTVPDPATDRFTSLMYFLYFQGYKCSIPLESIVTLPAGDANLTVALYADPDYIQSWMAAYLAFDITYMLLSVAMLIAYCRAREGEVPCKTARLWCLNTLVILIMDFWLTIIWGVEYRNLGDFVSKYSMDDSFGWATSVPGALLAITARGFVLWVINLILFIYFVRISIDWAMFNRCLTEPLIKDKNSRPDHRIPRVRDQRSSFRDPYDDRQAVVPYHHAQRPAYYNEGMVGETSFNEGYPQRQWERENPRHMEAEPPSHTRQLPSRYDPDDDFDILPAQTSFRPDDSFPVKGRPNARTVFDNKDRKNFEQGHGSPGKSYGAPMRVHQSARHNDNFY